MNTPNPGLKHMAPGLRTVHYDARSAGKVSLLVQPGDTLIVSDDVAAQLAAQSAQFKTDTDVPTDSAADAPTRTVDESSPSPDRASGAMPGEVTAVPTSGLGGADDAGDETPAPAPTKRAARKQAAKPKS